ncbi:carbon starvation induced protein CsiD [Salmonella enterica subsp. enterica serovar Kentucky]|uniref:carbon starvation induced protein CsiD n=1 Tax=Salmonella enterica TaxID=28901 RepID=UPI003F4B95C3
MHLDDWEHLESFFNQPLGRRGQRGAGPPTHKVIQYLRHPGVVFDPQRRPGNRFIVHIVQPKKI